MKHEKTVDTVDAIPAPICVFNYKIKWDHHANVALIAGMAARRKHVMQIM